MNVIITVQLDVLETCGAIILINENVVFQLRFKILGHGSAI